MAQLLDQLSGMLSRQVAAIHHPPWQLKSTTTKRPKTLESGTGTQSEQNWSGTDQDLGLPRKRIKEDPRPLWFSMQRSGSRTILTSSKRRCRVCLGPFPPRAVESSHANGEHF